MPDVKNSAGHSYIVGQFIIVSIVNLSVDEIVPDVPMYGKFTRVKMFTVKEKKLGRACLFVREKDVRQERKHFLRDRFVEWGQSADDRKRNDHYCRV